MTGMAYEAREAYVKARDAYYEARMAYIKTQKTHNEMQKTYYEAQKAYNEAMRRKERQWMLSNAKLIIKCPDCGTDLKPDSENSREWYCPKCKFGIEARED